MRFTDQMQRQVELSEWPPRRIVSLVPSQTELLADLGLDQQVVGITKFCVHPVEWFQAKPRIGGTKTVNFKKIEVLKPDLIIGNKEENLQEQIEELARHYPVWMSDITNLAEALEMIRQVGQLTGVVDSANKIAAEIETGFHEIITPATPLTAAYLIWRKPYMAAGSGTFVHEMLGYAGFRNVFEYKSRYPETSLLELANTQPQVILLSSEPYPFAEKHIAELQRECPASKIILVDGEIFSWYGSRLKLAPDYIKNLQKVLK